MKWRMEAEKKSKKEKEKLERKYYSLREISEMTGISKNYLWKKVRSGELKAIRIANRYLVPKEELEKIGIKL